MAIRSLLAALLLAIATAGTAAAQAPRPAACREVPGWAGLWRSPEGGSTIEIRADDGRAGSLSAALVTLSEAMRLTDHAPGQTALEGRFDCDRFIGRMLLTASGQKLTKLFYDCSWNGYFIDVQGRLTGPGALSISIPPFMVVKIYGGCRTLYPGRDRAEYDQHRRGGNWVVLSEETVVKAYRRD